MKQFHSLFLIPLLILGSLAPVASAQDSDTQFSPAGGTILANIDTERYNADPHIAMAPNGSFVVVWESEDDQGDSSIEARIFSTTGDPISTPFIVNQGEEERHRSPSVAVLNRDGHFVVVWEVNRPGADEQSWDVAYRLFDASGNPLSDERLANQTLFDQQKGADVAPNLVTGGFVITWGGHNAETQNFDIYFRGFDAAGEPLYDEQVVVSNQDHHYDPRVDISSIGTFAIIWETDTGDHSDIHYQLFDESGQPLLDQIAQVHTQEAEDQNDANVAMGPDGVFTIVWDSDHSGLLECYAMQFDAAGEPTGPSFQLNDTIQAHDPVISIEMISGNFVVAFVDSTYADDVIYAKQFTHDGMAIDQGYFVHQNNVFHQGVPDIAFRPDGAGFAVTWENTLNDGSTEILVRLFGEYDPTTQIDHYAVY